jgi:hypothetical protein
MRQKSGPVKEPAEKVVKDIRRATRRQFPAEEKIRIALEGLRGPRKVMVFQCPYGTSAFSRWTRGPQPLSSAMLVLSQSKDDPGLVDEDEALAIDPALIRLPARPLARDVRPGLLRRNDSFFEAQPLAMGELPNGPVVDPHTEARRSRFLPVSATTAWVSGWMTPQDTISLTASSGLIGSSITSRDGR